MAGHGVVAEVLGLIDAARLETRALQDRTVEEPARERRDQERRDVRPSRRLPEDGHLARVAPEGRDVVVHPFERTHQVEGAEVP